MLRPTRAIHRNPAARQGLAGLGGRPRAWADAGAATLALAIVLTATASMARAADTQPETDSATATATSQSATEQVESSEPGGESRTRAALQAARIDERLGERVPGDVAFIDDQGRDVTLGGYFDRGRPTLLVLGYYRCPMLCNKILNDLTASLQRVDFDPGSDFDVVFVGIDPTEPQRLAANKKAAYTDLFNRPGTEAGWHFLVGDQAAIDRTADAIGYRFAWDEQTQQWSHPAAIAVLTPEGTISRYLNGVRPSPTDLRLALIEAGEGAVGSPIDWLVQRCFVYDSATGKYTPAVEQLMRAGGITTVLVLGGVIGLAFYRERRRRSGRAAAAGGAGGSGGSGGEPMDPASVEPGREQGR